MLFSLIAYVAVALGGFGSIVGAFIGGVTIGLVEALSGLLVAPAFKYVFVFGVYLLVVFIGPRDYGEDTKGFVSINSVTYFDQI